METPLSTNHEEMAANPQAQPDAHELRGAVSRYDSIHLRAGFADTGLAPRSATLSSSPDIIPYGSIPVQDPFQLFVNNNWDQDAGQDLRPGQVNYIYMRGHNLLAGAQQGYMYLYYTKGTLLLWPLEFTSEDRSDWKFKGLTTASGAKTSLVRAAAGGDKVVTSDPFYWVPYPLAPNEHYCLVGWVETRENPNRLPTHLSTLEDFAEYIAQPGSFCFRSVTRIALRNPVSTTTIRYEQGEMTDSVALLLVCTGLPVGSQVSFSGAAAGATPSINLEKTTVTNENAFVAGVFCEVPAGFSSAISYSYYANDAYPARPAEFKIELVAVYVVPAGHRLYQCAASLAEMAVPQALVDEIKQRKQYDVSGGALKGIRLGSDTMVARQNEYSAASAPQL